MIPLAALQVDLVFSMRVSCIVLNLFCSLKRYPSSLEVFFKHRFQLIPISDPVALQLTLRNLVLNQVVHRNAAGQWKVAIRQLERRLVLLAKCHHFPVIGLLVAQNVRIENRARGSKSADEVLQLRPLFLRPPTSFYVDCSLSSDEVILVASLAVNNPGLRAANDQGIVFHIG